MKLTSEQIKSLQTLAAKNGMRLLVTRNQVGIGYAGQLAFSVVYTYGSRKPWDFCMASDKALMQEMRSIIQ